jgi:hypothetical protein
MVVDSSLVRQAVHPVMEHAGSSLYLHELATRNYFELIESRTHHAWSAPSIIILPSTVWSPLKFEICNYIIVSRLAASSVCPSFHLHHNDYEKSQNY